MPPGVHGESAEETPTIFAIGAAVRLHGLLRKPELNGCIGTLVEDLGERWGTQIEGELAPVSLKKSNLQLVMPEGYWELAPGSLATIHGLQSRIDLNGKAASLAQFVGERWAVQIEDSEDLVRLKASNLSPLFCGSLPTASWERDIAELESLANIVLQEFVEGAAAYPVCRRLGSLKVTPTSQELRPVATRAGRYFPDSWCDLEIGESERLFYKMSLCSRCSELTYTFADVVNHLANAGTPVFRGSEIAGMFICVGFVVHAYRRVHLVEDFGQVYWQHSRQVHNGSRNHAWLEFPLPGAPPSDQKARVILDLSAAQFDMCSPMKRFGLVRGQDQRYRKCYELPCTAAPLHFLNWAAAQNNVRFEAKHCVQSIRTFRQKLGLSGGVSCIDAHQILDAILDQIGVAGPGQLLAQVSTSPKLCRVEEACGMRLEALREMDATAAGRMRQELGTGPSHETGGCPAQ